MPFHLPNWFVILFPRPVFPGDPEKTRIAAVSNDLIGVILLGAFIYGIVALLFNSYLNTGNVLIGWGCWVVMLALRMGLNSGRVFACSFLFGAVIAGASVLTSYRLGAVASPNLAWALVAVIYCVLTVGARAGGLLLLASTAGAAWIAHVEAQLPAAVIRAQGPWVQWAIFVSAGLMLYALGMLVRRQMSEAQAQATMEHSALEAEREARRRLLENANRTLEMRVAQRTAELRQANADLQRASQHLIQSEKLAALGGLVAGIAHELNTPIGNARLTATGLAARMEEIAAQVRTGRVSRSALEDFLTTGIESMRLIERATERSSELVDSFKQVAVDQTGMQRRVFNLKKIIEQTVQMMGPVLKRSPYVLHIEVAPDIELDGYPGAVEQIITAFIDNALLHAFTGREAGSMRITGILAGEQVELRFADDGIGMSADVSSRAFEPFFTTKFGQGGSGLGLYTVYNLVTSLFGGTITVSSHPGKGATFTVRFTRTHSIAEAA